MELAQMITVKAGKNIIISKRLLTTKQQFLAMKAKQEEAFLGNLGQG